jgi:Photosynthetic reaction centre cytochrome C subunit/Tetratricopeptide repeat
MFMKTNQQRSAWMRTAFLLSFFIGLSQGLGQIPDKFTNLQVLPKEIGKRELMDTMRGFTGALGVRCPYCHVGEEGKPFSTFDFSADTKAPKQTARIMLRMVEAINNDHLAKITATAATAPEVACITCHHGETQPPQPLEDILFETISAQGSPEAVKKYNELREKYYGGYVYDFRDGVLNRLAQRLDHSGKTDDALAMLQLNAQMNPNTAMTYFFMGEIYLKKGDKAAALENYKKTVSLAPDNDFAKRKIEELSK